MSETRRAVLMDVDTGIDDALAILLALRSSEADVIGIGTVTGNTTAAQAATNTLKVLDAAGADVPVATGCGKPLLRAARLSRSVHGEDGMGDAGFPPPTRAPSGEHAVDQIIRLAHARPGKITLFASGPLTNIAAALIREPRLPQLVHELVIMGGAIAAPGNVTPVAEANIYNDPEAARLVFAEEWPLTLVSLDVTMRTLLRTPELERLRAAHSRVARFVARMLPVYSGVYTRRFGFEACALHDPLAMGILLDRTLVTEAAKLDVQVETAEGLTLGMIVADRRPLIGPGYARPERPITIPLAVDGPRFMERLMDALLA